jgi:hypothetical protein
MTDLILQNLKDPFGKTLELVLLRERVKMFGEQRPQAGKSHQDRLDSKAPEGAMQSPEKSGGRDVRD